MLALSLLNGYRVDEIFPADLGTRSRSLTLSVTHFRPRCSGRRIDARPAFDARLNSATEHVSQGGFRSVLAVVHDVGGFGVEIGFDRSTRTVFEQLIFGEYTAEGGTINFGRVHRIDWFGWNDLGGIETIAQHDNAASGAGHGQQDRR